MSRALDSLDGLNTKQLRELRDRIDAAILSREKTERIELRARLTAMADASGLTLDEIFGSSRGKVSTVAVKFRNPENVAETWTGRGRMPNWLNEKLKKRGTSKDDFAI